jgi:hypothetical protein
MAVRSFVRASRSLLAAVFLAACGSDEDAGAPQGPDPDPRPAGPAARVVGLLSGGNGLNLAAGRSQPLPNGWVEEEYALEGAAVSYASEGNLPADGTYVLREDTSAHYRIRIVVRRPGAAADFNGTVIVEWFNVSGGLDANPDFVYLADEIYREGYAWVGVSAQRLGIEGGPVLITTPMSEQAGAGRGLRVLDPERYGELHHPGDAFGYDIFTQVARTLRVRSSAGVLGPLVPTRILAAGESQSAFMLTTYANGVQPLARQYDGFFVHSRGGGAAPLGAAGAGVDLPTAIAGGATRFRTDLEAPILVLQTEGDMLSVIGYFPARQDDTERLRVWEVAGTAHADAYLVGNGAGSFSCGAPINTGPTHLIAKAALRHLDAWSRGGAPAPAGPRLQIESTGATPVLLRDQDGIALGGIRTPQVDAPIDILSGEAAPGGPIACILFGSTKPLPAERIAARYASPTAYLEAYNKAADATIGGGFVLAEDREALLADADPSRVGGN